MHSVNLPQNAILFLYLIIYSFKNQVFGYKRNSDSLAVTARKKIQFLIPRKCWKNIL